MTKRVEQQICIILALSLNLLHRNNLDDSEGCTCGQAEIGHVTTTTHLHMHHIACRVFLQNNNHTGDSAPLQPRCGALWPLAFPKTKITFEREEISDHQRDSGKYNRVADGDRKNCTRSQGAYFEGDQGVIVLCTMFLVSPSVSVFIFHTSWLVPSGQTWNYLFMYTYIYTYSVCVCGVCACVYNLFTSIFLQR